MDCIGRAACDRKGCQRSTRIGLRVISHAWLAGGTHIGFPFPGRVRMNGTRRPNTQRCRRGIRHRAGGKLYVFGRLGLDWKAMGMVMEYDPRTDRWTRKRDMPHARHHVVLAETWMLSGEPCNVFQPKFICSLVLCKLRARVIFRHWRFLGCLIYKCETRQVFWWCEEFFLCHGMEKKNMNIQKICLLFFASSLWLALPAQAT